MSMRDVASMKAVPRNSAHGRCAFWPIPFSSSASPAPAPRQLHRLRRDRHAIFLPGQPGEPGDWIGCPRTRRAGVKLLGDRPGLALLETVSAKMRIFRAPEISRHRLSCLPRSACSSISCWNAKTWKSLEPRRKNLEEERS